MNKSLSAAVIATAILLGGCTSDAATTVDTTVIRTDSSIATEATIASESTDLDTKAADSTTAIGPTDSSAVASAISSAPNASALGSDTSLPPPVQAVTNVIVQPGLSDDGFVGAASDVTTEHCELASGRWAVDGKVTNSSGSDASYRIYVALNRKGTTDTRALLQVNMDVPDGKTVPWTTAAELSDSDLICILRVERTAKK